MCGIYNEYYTKDTLFLKHRITNDTFYTNVLLIPKVFVIGIIKMYDSYINAVYMCSSTKRKKKKVEKVFRVFLKCI